MSLKRLAVVDVKMGRFEISGTSRKGFLPKGTKYKDVVKVFGKPTYDYGKGDKVQVIWIGYINKKIFTVYDYVSDTTPEKNTDWHIGGHDESVLPLVLEYFNSKSGKASVGRQFFHVEVVLDGVRTPKRVPFNLFVKGDTVKTMQKVREHFEDLGYSKVTDVKVL